ncbi:MAG TPA: HD domain-containing phosphohydrolase [Gaiellaceae bacterium]|nr:HD domain-containing phosphohydrolase [Gaiellaceae bacterium]
MSKTLKITGLVVAIGVLPLLIVGALVKQRESDRAAVESSLVSRANVQATELEAGFARGRTIALLMASNPSFFDFYSQPGSRAEKVAAQGRTIDRVHNALAYLERLYPGQIGEACFIDRNGLENARVVQGLGASPSTLSNESQNPFFRPSFAQPLGGVYQSEPYVSPDTGEWVIGTATPVAGPSGTAAAIVHFELTIESFRTAASRFSGGDEVAIVDADTGAVVVNTRREQRIGAKLGDPSDRRFVGLSGSRGLVERGGSLLAYRLVGGTTTNRWLVVAVAPRPGSLAIVPIAAVLLALLGLALLMGRRWTRKSEEAETDPLTGLGNRRKLATDLSRLLPATNTSNPLTLCVYDLNGFKNYNDSFGHPAGDVLLTRFGSRLAAAALEGSAYRLGGDEFCVLIAGDAGELDPVLAATREALSDRGEGWTIDCAHGTVLLPADARDVEGALRLADQRLYEAKQSGRRSPSRQSTDVLLQALRERDPDLGSHLHDVGGLTAAVGARIGLVTEELDALRLAGELHDIGKVAIPDAILSKPGPLDPDEWNLIRQHTLIGERILAAAPALSYVAKLVRSSHERHDGTGYPEAKSAEEIPLGSRIVAVCDAFDAMIGPRPYRLGMSEEVAIAELRRCAGTQFDPEVVEVFCALRAEERTESVLQRSTSR